MDNIDYKKSFHKTEEMLLESYKILECYKKVNEILRYELENIINNYQENDFTKMIRHKLKETNEIIENITQH